MLKKVSIFCASAVFILTGCTPRAQVGEPDFLTVQPILLISPEQKGMPLLVEVARTPEERSKGLMFREELPADTGMLFLFDQPRKLSFWMKNTLIPLDIIFFDAQGKVVSTQSMVPCTEKVCSTYDSGAPSLSALEVSQGFVRRYGVGEGWSMQILEMN